ncbi:nickel insertion protein, partial [Mitsuokella sp.]|uniref:nickel insertion protein n=1 Tax=Mitsuokella sp. TaxID=2049034 RepID=UPI003D7C8583
MKAIYLDCFAGISGNMLLGAFLQAGVPENYLRAELQKLPLGNSYDMKIQTVRKNGIDAVYVDVELLQEQEHHEHHEHEHHHAHRTMAVIRQMLTDSTLKQSVKDKSLAIFEKLAEAEG